MGNNPSSQRSSATTRPRASSSRRLLQALGVGSNHPGVFTSDGSSSRSTGESSGGGEQSISPPKQEPPPLEYIDGGQTNTFGKLYPGEPDYDMNIVKKFILDRRLGPFFAPVDELLAAADADEKNVTGEDGKSISELTEGIHDAKISSKDESVVISSYPEEAASECPICFMTYPPYFNYTKCCDQPICTECFIQIKRPESTFEPASCPYCQTPHFSIIYQSKESLAKSSSAAPISIDTTHTSSAGQEKAAFVESPQDAKESAIPSVLEKASENPENFEAPVPATFVNSVSLSRRQSNHPVITSDDIRPDWKQRKQKMELDRILEQQRLALATARRRQMEAFSQAEVANAALFAAHVYENSASTSTGSGLGSALRSSFRNSGSRRSDENSAQYVRAMRYLGADVEELMLLEAMRRSMQDANAASPPTDAPPVPDSTAAVEPEVGNSSLPSSE